MERPGSPLNECLPKRIPPDDLGRVTVTRLAQAGREKFTDKQQFDGRFNRQAGPASRS